MTHSWEVEPPLLPVCKLLARILGLKYLKNMLNWPKQELRKRFKKVDDYTEGEAI